MTRTDSWALRFSVLLLLLSLLAVPNRVLAAPLTTMQGPAVGTGTATGNGVPLNVADKGIAGLAVTGTFVGTITFEGSTNGNTTWSSVSCTTIDTQESSSTTTTTGQFTCNTAGLTGLRARISTYTSGTIIVTGYPTAAGGGSGAGGSGGGLSSVATATEAVPTATEGANVTLSTDLRKILRATLMDMLFGEDADHDLLKTSGGEVRQSFLLGSVAGPATATDATTAAMTLDTGMKTFQGVVSCTGTCVQTQEIRGGWTSAYAVGDTVWVCTLTISGTTKANDWCATDRNFPFWYVVTTLTSGTTPLSLLSVAY